MPNRLVYLTFIRTDDMFSMLLYTIFNFFFSHSRIYFFFNLISALQLFLSISLILFFFKNSNLLFN